MLDAVMRGVPLGLYRPLRQALHDYPRRHPLRLAATVALRRAALAYRGRLAAHMAEIRPLDMPHLSFLPVDSMVMDAVYWLGVRGYEGTVAQAWKALCAHSSAVLEVGGNVGIFTVVGAKAGPARYTVVEPVPRNAATLRANLARNGLEHVVLLEAAVIPGAEPRDVTLNVPPEGRDMPVGSHLLEGVEIAERGNTAHITVKGLPIMELAQGCDLIKIDAEGIEATLLTEIRAMILERHPTLVVEVLPEASGLGALLSALAVEAGYTITVLPEYGSDDMVAVPAGSFTSSVPGQYHAKDVVLHAGPFPALVD